MTTETSNPETVSKYAQDIPYSLALQAFEWNSIFPERGAARIIQDYIQTLEGDYELLSQYATDEAKAQLLDEQFTTYRTGFRRRFLAKLAAQSRTASAFVTGPSNFPTARNQKRLDTDHRRYTELTEYRDKTLAAIRRKLLPEQFIKSADVQAVPKIESKLEKLEALQLLMTAANKIIRKHKCQASAIPELIAAGMSEAQAKELLTPDCFGGYGFPSYKLTNNGAEIRRLKARAAEVATMQTTEAKETEHAGGIRIVENPDLGRIQILFPGKPSAEHRDVLKSHGFRWAPSEGAWQRHLNNAGRYAAKTVLEQIK